MIHWWFWGLPFLGIPMYFGGLGMLLMILFWVIVIGLIFLLIRGTTMGLGDIVTITTIIMKKTKRSKF